MSPLPRHSIADGEPVAYPVTPHEVRICGHHGCGTELSQYNPGEFCSLHDHVAPRIPERRVLPGRPVRIAVCAREACAREFKTTRANALYCSDGCRTRAFLERKKSGARASAAGEAGTDAAPGPRASEEEMVTVKTDLLEELRRTEGAKRRTVDLAEALGCTRDAVLKAAAALIADGERVTVVAKGQGGGMYYGMPRCGDDDDPAPVTPPAPAQDPSPEQPADSPAAPAPSTPQEPPAAGGTPPVAEQYKTTAFDRTAVAVDAGAVEALRDKALGDPRPPAAVDPAQYKAGWSLPAGDRRMTLGAFTSDAELAVMVRLEAMPGEVRERVLQYAVDRWWVPELKGAGQ